MDAWITWAIQGAVALVFMLGAAYVRSIINGLKDKIAENQKDIGKNAGDIEVNEKGIIAAKTELYEHGEKTFYTKETMDAKIIALKYRSDGRTGDPNNTI